MEKIYILLLSALICSQGYSQTFSEPTRREVYDYAVGDTFISHLGSSIGGNQYDMIVIWDRVDYGNDSIVYSAQSTFAFGDLKIVSQISKNFTILFLDSIYRFGWPYNNLDSTSFSISDGDTIYKAYASSWMTCNHLGDEYSCEASVWISARKGFGITSDGYYNENGGVGTSLVYAHKANGKIWGTPQNFITGMDDIAGERHLNIFPNSTTSQFQLQLPQSPQPETYFKLYDGLGRMVKQQNIGLANTVLYRDALTSGIYFWQLETKGVVIDKGKLIFQ